MAFDLTWSISSLVLAVSVCIAVFSALTARASLRVNHHVQRWTVNYNLLTHTHDMLQSTPTLLNIYGIDLDELADDGITPSELVFIYSHLDAGGAYHRLGNEKTVKLTDFRTHFLSNSKVQVAWKKHLRHTMFSPSPYRTAIDKFYAEHEHSPHASSK